jgi:TRAP-type C4-dicarboxylate transport system permease small subunit
MLALSARPVAAAQQAHAAEKQLKGRRDVTVPTVTSVTEDPNADRTREQLMQLLEKYPPSLGRVLKLDPSLLGNTDYLATYPALSSFLTQHPDVVRAPAYYLERIRTGNEYQDNRSESYRMWNDLLGWMGGLTVAALVATSLGWFIRLLVDYRRWYRLSKVQAEAHNKLLDRMTANEELLAYVQSPAGSRFLESAPIALDPGSRRIGAPFNRILWSVQAGLVLGAAGLGLQYVSGRITTSEAAQPLYTLGVLALALGIGFVLSAVVSYVLSSRLGLFEKPEAEQVAGGK